MASLRVLCVCVIYKAATVQSVQRVRPLRVCHRSESGETNWK